MAEKKIIRLVVYFANKKVWNYMAPHNTGGRFSQMLHEAEEFLNRYDFGLNLNRSMQELQWHTKLLAETDKDKNGIDFYAGVELQENEAEEYEKEKKEYLEKYKKIKISFSASVSDEDAEINRNILDYFNSSQHRKKSEELSKLFKDRTRELISRCEVRFLREYNIDNGFAHLPILICENTGKSLSKVLGATWNLDFIQFPRSILINIESCNRSPSGETFVHEIIHAAKGEHSSSLKNIMYPIAPSIISWIITLGAKLEMSAQDKTKLADCFFVKQHTFAKPYSTPPTPVNPKVPIDKNDPY